MGGTLAFWNFVMDKYAETGPRLADAMDVGPYKDRFFRTSRLLYHIDSKGTIFGRDEIDNAGVALIGGIEPATYAEEYHSRGWGIRKPGEIKTEEVVDLIVRHGRPAKEGDVLAVVFDPSNTRYGKSPWLLTSNILRIIETSELPVC